MNKIFSMAAMAVAVLATSVFTSCSKDNNNDPTEPTVTTEYTVSYALEVSEDLYNAIDKVEYTYTVPGYDTKTEQATFVPDNSNNYKATLSVKTFKTGSFTVTPKITLKENISTTKEEVYLSFFKETYAGKSAGFTVKKSGLDLVDVLAEKYAEAAKSLIESIPAEYTGVLQ